MVIDMGYDRYRADQILVPLYCKFPKSIADIKQLPKEMIAELVDAGYTIGLAKEVHKITSDDGDTTKVLLNLTNDKSVETVLMQYESEKVGGLPRSTVCVSTQIGCAMGCTFCATGQMGFETNLNAEHIVSQVIHFEEIIEQRNLAVISKGDIISLESISGKTIARDAKSSEGLFSCPHCGHVTPYETIHNTHMKIHYL